MIGKSSSDVDDYDIHSVMKIIRDQGDTIKMLKQNQQVLKSKIETLQKKQLEIMSQSKNNEYESVICTILEAVKQDFDNLSNNHRENAKVQITEEIQLLHEFQKKSQKEQSQMKATVDEVLTKTKQEIGKIRNEILQLKGSRGLVEKTLSEAFRNSSRPVSRSRNSVSSNQSLSKPSLRYGSSGNDIDSLINLIDERISERIDGQLFSSRGLFTSSKVLPQTHLTLNQEIESFDDVNDKINQQHSDKSLSSNSVIEPNRDSQMEQLEKDVAAFTKKFRSELNQLQLAQENNIHNQMKIKNKVKGLGEAMSSISHIRGAVEKILSETQQKSQEQSIHIQTGLDELASRILELEKARESGSDFNSLLEVQNSKQESFRKMILDDVRLSLNETQNDIKCIENGLTSRTIALQDGMNKVRISIQDILEVQTEQRKGLEGALTSVDEIIRMDKEIEDLRNITRDIVDLLNTQGFHIMWKS